MKRWMKRFSLALVAMLIVLWLLSPYKHQDGFPYRLIKVRVKIDAPADSVFRFLGNSANAAKWSVFVDHISTLNTAVVEDGKAGSIRRCYRYANNTSTQWDEVITEVIPDRKRQISCYNLVGFPLSAGGLGTEQLYTPLSKDGCELTFTLFYMTAKPTWGKELRIKFAGYYIKNIFAKNLNNIKRIVESGK